MKIKLVPILSYQVETPTGQAIGVFEIGDTWRGMTYLSGQAGEIVIESPDAVEQFERDMGRLFSMDELPKPYDATVVRASLPIIEALSTPPQNTPTANGKAAKK